ncbi:MAG: ABC transporter permease [Vicinamibacteria bacterium]
MALPLRYNVRNVRVRWQLTLLAVGGIALVVAVFTVLMAMSAGFEKALRTTGRTDNAIVVQRGSGSSSLVVRMTDKAAIPELDRWIRAQPQMQLQAVSERKYYEDQAGPLSKALRGLATFVAVVMGVGAVFGAINTMYAIVSARTREIGTLRALGFSRRSILVSFLIESVILAAVGGAIGCVLAVPMNGFSTGTGQTQSFSELAFAFQITPQIVATSMVFAVLMGVLGGLLPALRGARLPITSALRSM